ncbi:MAG: hypothetical protein Q8P33_02545 [bacterium]|nr:hypothetical protein [bacterium]
MAQHLSDRKSQPGYIALVSVLVVGAVGVVVATSMLLLGVGGSRTSLAEQQSNQAQALADACAEDALQEIRDSTPFTGTVMHTIGAGSCSATVTSLGGQNREIESTATVDDVTRRVNIFVDSITPDLTILSWEEVAGF